MGFSPLTELVATAIATATQCCHFKSQSQSINYLSFGFSVALDFGALRALWQDQWL